MYATITINNEVIHPQKMKSTQIVFSMENHLPVFQMSFVDSSGDVLSNLPFTMGSPVKFTVWEAEIPGTILNSDKPPKELASYNFIISKMYGDDVANPNVIGGYITVIAVHPWQFFKDYTPHCYAPMKASELIRKVVEDDSRGYELKMDDESKDTDTTCKYPRYKTNESDLDFVLNKVLPFATINNAPAYFFATDKNTILLSSFQELINKSVKAVLVPTQLDDKLKLAEYASIAENFGLQSVLKYVGLQHAIGGGTGTDYVSKLLPKFYMEDLGTHKLLAANKRPTTKMSKGDSIFTGNKVPLKDTTFGGMNPTSSTVLMNRETDDQINLAINFGRDLDKMFRVTLNTEYSVDLTVGAVVYLYVPSYQKTELGTNAIHWMTGKWLIYQTMHVVQQTGDKINTELVLVRPTFSMNEQKTTLADVDSYLEV